MSLTKKILSQVPGDALGGLRKVDRLWENLKQNTAPTPAAVKHSQQPLETIDFDIVIGGGTLGILIGTALAVRGWRVALLERGILRGREQEWNISRKELDAFLELNLLTAEEIDKAIATEYNPARISFTNTPDIWVRDVLNIGIDPVYLLETLKQKFLQAGGKLFENTPFKTATIHPNGVIIESENTENPLFSTRLLLDAMGHFSPIVRQARQGKKPDAVCLVVGSCAQGFPKNETGDIFASFTPMQNQCQYFWEAFPARDGRTTYLFTYIDADTERFSLETLFEDYLRLLPEYQNVELEQLKFQRALYGFFPCYRQSPLKMPWNRILPVGDSSGSQSPLSFGGFGAMVRHLKRLTLGIEEALTSESLDKNSLALLQPYQPNLSVTWLFQRSMSAGMNQKIDANQINQLLAAVFQVMEELGEPVLKPFLQDIVLFPALSQTLFKTAICHPGLVMKIIPQVGIANLLDWMVHYVNLGIYTGLQPLGKAVEPQVKKLGVEQQYYFHRLVEAWEYGAGGDY
ncbi:MAG: FAD-binding oxidoreductase [Microcoleus sp. PH2017_10_PVI_O_A]|uniref:FAD-dependent oxidoreductase n=1 Tax=unclassified Microcoleus TaxID=2642155 RepID=UPI001D5D5CBC|nr:MULTISPECIES: FAD-dependent oxidoreductase [unclassified Microcoleus]TAE82853.1 MAG: FAD-binding oxidoreductase [Oscillatoriales cyanobacterium]MCC3409977.1 FAD-binding oxidoreductase [Microcoleus sp. PH2017_10_PVI_O_A]MCC3463703.1 FAD-binding oxidoreductase [Microcoleus sp. PH2017_11_PCY_U_A]MCC3482714.1 FAD-binding oxidoreductase [Microcoleus sp. PH2017_12_PCY_D_A]MCC3532394.1 FAD-binding oxidoreductase [Microcoleus sp. PH2017_21_RUC_O_A]